MTKSNPQLHIQMRRDLFAAYRDVTSRPCPTQMLAWVRTIRHPAPRFYVSTKRAANIISGLVNGDTSQLDKLPTLKQKMYLELYSKVIELSERKEFQGKDMKHIISFAISQPASSFFITVERLRYIFRNAKRYGIDFTDKEIRPLNRQYTNYKDGKPKTAVFTGKKHLLASL